MNKKSHERSFFWLGWLVVNHSTLLRCFLAIHRAKNRGGASGPFEIAILSPNWCPFWCPFLRDSTVSDGKRGERMIGIKAEKKKRARTRLLYSKALA